MHEFYDLYNTLIVTKRHRAAPNTAQQVVKRVQHFIEQECWALLGEMVQSSFDQGLKEMISKAPVQGSQEHVCDCWGK